MSTTTQPRQQPSSTSTEVPTLRRKPTFTVVTTRHRGRTAFAAASLLAAGVCVAALWIGVGQGSDVQAPGPTPAVGSPYVGSATAAEHRLELQRQGGDHSSTPYVGSATAAEHRLELQRQGGDHSSTPFVGSATAAEHRLQQKR
jgi:hypothetical protein